MPVYIYIYIRGLVTQSVCSRAELTRVGEEEDWSGRSIHRGRVEKASFLLGPLPPSLARARAGS